MAFNAEIADRVLKVLEGREGLTERKMFGGIAFMLNGNMCCGATNDDLMVRVGADGLEDALDQPHARPMDFTGRPMKGSSSWTPAPWGTGCFGNGCSGA